MTTYSRSWRWTMRMLTATCGCCNNSFLWIQSSWCYNLLATNHSTQTCWDRCYNVGLVFHRPSNLLDLIPDCHGFFDLQGMMLMISVLVMEDNMPNLSRRFRKSFPKQKLSFSRPCSKRGSAEKNHPTYLRY